MCVARSCFDHGFETVTPCFDAHIRFRDCFVYMCEMCVSGMHIWGVKSTVKSNVGDVKSNNHVAHHDWTIPITFHYFVYCVQDPTLRICMQNDMKSVCRSVAERVLVMVLHATS
jgi:hypothetical protein